MKLTGYKVTKFRNILDSTKIEVEDDVTCLVGKNESGKTATLSALYRLNPAYNATFNVGEHYPRWLLTKDRRAGLTDSTTPIEATFTIEQPDIDAVEAKVGPEVLKSDSFTYGRTYGEEEKNTAIVDVDAKKALTTLLKDQGLKKKLIDELDLSRTSELDASLQTMIDAREPEDEEVALLKAAKQSLSDVYDGQSVWQVVVNILKDRMPKFFYFDQYSILPGRIDLDQIAKVDDGPAATELQTARALIELAGTNISSLKEEDYEERKSELEAVSNDLSEQVFEYWKQNTELEVIVDVDKETVTDSRGEKAVARYFDVRIKDKRHGFTSNFGLRSSGFQWFFSFLAAFSEFENIDQGVVVLLDEPGLALHGKAQADFLRFIEERLAPSAQVLYTTHSPFMVDMSKLERVRVVEDKGPKIGAQVSDEVLSVGKDTIFPLQAGLGYGIAQSLFIGPDNLVVEGVSDYVYIDLMSEYFGENEGEKLNENITISPAGGSTNIPTFVALMGKELGVSVLVDSGTKGIQKLNNLASEGLLDAKRLLTVGSVTGANNADIEDLFTPGDYVKLYNATFGKTHKVSDLPPGDRIIDRISRKEGVPFEKHARPAQYLVKNRDSLMSGLSETTLNNFQELIKAINKSFS